MARRGRYDPLYDLVDKQHIDHAHTFSISPLEGDAQRGIRRAYWLALSNAEKIVAEGKIFLPQKPMGSRLIIFETGMPGDGTCELVERDHIPFFLHAGYHGLILRHLGAWMDADTRNGQDSMIHCPERVVLGQKRGEKTLGEPHPYPIDDLASEVVAATNIMGKKFDKIALVGHSSGALAALWSIPDIEETTRLNITHIISLAGLTGGIENLTWLKRWGAKQHLKQCQNFINLVDPATNLERLQGMFERIYANLLPDNIMLIQINTPKDEYIHPEAAIRYQAHLNRGLNIIDETQTEKKYHFLKNLRGETLLKLLQGYHPTARHVVTFKRIEPKDAIHC